MGLELGALHKETVLKRKQWQVLMLLCFLFPELFLRFFIRFRLSLSSVCFYFLELFPQGAKADETKWGRQIYSTRQVDKQSIWV
eukprot:COSAG06_NODE_33875_length_483_cov_0.625000_1_plen_83_part_01